MIKHVVLFKMKPFSSDEEKAAKLNEIKDDLENLLGIVPGLLTIEAGININSAEEYDLALTTTHESMDDLNIYANHPDHKAVGAKIRAVLDRRACADFKY